MNRQNGMLDCRREEEEEEEGLMLDMNEQRREQSNKKKEKQGKRLAFSTCFYAKYMTKHYSQDEK
jgi:hypothetical protein